MPQIALTMSLDDLDPERVEEACFELGALAVSYTDQRDDPILEPAPGEFRLWPHSRLQALFSFDTSPEELIGSLSHVLRVDPARFTLETLADRVWEREWLRDFHPMCFGQRLWVAPHHSHVHTQGAVIVRLDPGLAFGTGTHATTALRRGPDAGPGDHDERQPRKRVEGVRAVVPERLVGLEREQADRQD